MEASYLDAVKRHSIPVNAGTYNTMLIGPRFFCLSLKFLATEKTGKDNYNEPSKLNTF